MKRYLKEILIFLCIFSLELLFMKIANFKFNNIAIKLVMFINISFLISLLLCIKNKFIKGLVLFTVPFIYIANIVYYNLFNNILTFKTFLNGILKAYKFIPVLLKYLLKYSYIIIIGIILIVLIILLFKNKKIIFNNNIKTDIVGLVLSYIVMIIMVLCIHNDEIYSYKNVYYKLHNNYSTVKSFGLINTVRLDIEKTIIGFKEKNIDDSNINYNYNYDGKYNILDIDFDNINENKEIKEISSYLKNTKASSQNKYTGIYEGKNLIVFICESFSNIAIREDLTPTLYKMRNESFKFENFYTPLFPVSTADGEYLTDTSLIPAEGLWSIEETKDNIFPYTYANVFKNLGYKTYAYHDWLYNYYKRDIYMKSIGYDSYIGNGNGLEKKMSFKQNPPSDYEMVKNTIDDYINNDHFVAYYMTMSGHIDYNKSNSMVKKNYDKVKDLDYSENLKGYLATQIELDKALEELLNRLEEAGKLDDTIIILSGDHYPYGLTYEEMQAGVDYQIDEEFDKFRMPFILYDSNIKEPIVIDKYASSLDILPTILNLFGIKFDSRLLMGRDILSDSDPLVIFSDRSFITDKGRYNNMSETFIPSGDEKISDDYVKNTKKDIYKKYRYSRLILNNNYYKYIK